MQNLYPLDRYALGPDPGFGQLTVTIGKYYRVTGESTQHRGVQPDISMPTAISTEEVGESTRESALPWDRIRPVDFGRETQLSAGRRDARALARGAHRRRSGLPRCCSPISTRSRRCARQKKLSLNLKTRIAEREQMEKERMARENERRAARGLKPLSTLADLNGAEPPDAVLAETAEIAADLTGMKGVFLSRLKSEAERPATP